MGEGRLDRRDFLRLATGGAVCAAAAGTGCSSGSDKPKKDPAARPQNKYALLADAARWSTNVGSPGPFNAAVDEVFNLSILPKLFSAAARGEKSPADAVAAAEAEMRPIFEKWRERGKI